MAATRVAVVLVPQWPLVAAKENYLRVHEVRTASTESSTTGSGGQVEAGPPALLPGAEAPVVLVQNHRVVDADTQARAHGVAAGMRQRSARSLCPHALLLERDEEVEGALFDTVAAAVDTVAAGVEVLTPGVLLMRAAGPARHQGGEESLAEKIIDAVADHTGWDCTVGIAEGPLAAYLAAAAGRIIHPGRSADYLAPHSIQALLHVPLGEPAEAMVDLLERLGIRTLGDFAALPAATVTDRFGPDAAHWHLLCRGEEATPPAAHHPPQPILVEKQLEDPLLSADQAAFAARPLAEELQQRLREHALVCTRLRILARTEDGTEWERTWRHEGALSAADVVDRVRWQCNGWITRAQIEAARSAAARHPRGTAQQTDTVQQGNARWPGGEHQQGSVMRTGAIVHLSLIPVQLIPAVDTAPGLWGDAGEAAHRAEKALARAQGLGGEQAVVVPAPGSGRLLAEQMCLVPWRHEKPAPRPGPWPGALPDPPPATVFRTRPAVQILDRAGAAVVVTARGILSGEPAQLTVQEPAVPALLRVQMRPGSQWPVLAHSAPVVLDERWWQQRRHRGARLQLLLDGEPPTAVLALSRQGQWSLEGLYD